MRPFMQRLYKTRAAAYRDSAQQFIEGYNEGFQEAIEPQPLSGGDKGKEPVSSGDMSGALMGEQGREQQSDSELLGSQKQPPPVPPPKPS